jgi:hypothetical protein
MKKQNVTMLKLLNNYLKNKNQKKLEDLLRFIGIINLKNEFDLIENKKSKLSKTKRDLVVFLMYKEFGVKK